MGGEWWGSDVDWMCPGACWGLGGRLIASVSLWTDEFSRTSLRACQLLPMPAATARSPEPALVGFDFRKLFGRLDSERPV